MAKKQKSPTEITSIRHKKDTRVNIPTEELRDFVAEDEKAAKAIRRRDLTCHTRCENSNMSKKASDYSFGAKVGPKPQGGGGAGRNRREIRQDEIGGRGTEIFVAAVQRDIISESQALDYLDIPAIEFERLRNVTTSA